MDGAGAAMQVARQAAAAARDPRASTRRTARAATRSASSSRCSRRDRRSVGRRRRRRPRGAGRAAAERLARRAARRSGEIRLRRACVNAVLDDAEPPKIVSWGDSGVALEVGLAELACRRWRWCWAARRSRAAGRARCRSASAPRWPRKARALPGAVPEHEAVVLQAESPQPASTAWSRSSRSPGCCAG